MNTNHLDALHLRLSHERSRLASAKCEKERQMRQVWVAGIEKEIADEQRFLGLESTPIDMSDDELMKELLA